MLVATSQSDRRRTTAVHIRRGLDVGTGAQQESRDVGRIARRLLPKVFDAISGDVVQESRVMPAR